MDTETTTDCNGVGVAVFQSHQPKVITSLLKEQGLASGAPMQARCNHRQLKMSVFHHRHVDDKGEWHPPLLQSLISPTSEQWFSTTNYMTFTLCTVRTRMEGDPYTFGSQMKYHFKDNNNRDVFARLHSNMIDAGPVKATEFDRLCSMFGFRWKGTNSGKFVSLANIAAFYKQLKAHTGTLNLATNTGLRYWMEKFSLDRFYDVDPDMSAEANFDRLGQVIRSLVPIRVNFIEGQHRADAIAFGGVGNYNPTDTVEVDISKRRCNIHSAALRLNLNFGKTIANQVYERQTFQVAVHNGESWKQQCDAFCDFGCNIDQSKSIVVRTTVASTTLESFDYFETCWIAGTSELETDWYWQADYPEFKERMETNLSLVVNAHLRYIKMKKRTTLFHRTWTHDNNKIPKAIEDFFCSLKAKLKSNRTFTGIGTNHIPFLMAMKYLCMTRESRTVLCSFLSQQPPKKLQYEMKENDYSLYFFTPNFVLHNMIRCALHSQKHIMGVLAEELWLIHYVRNKANGDDIVRRCMKSNNWDLSQNNECHKVITRSLPSNEYHSASSLGAPTQLGKILSRTNFIIMEQLMSDIFNTVLKYGPNPAMTHSDFYTLKEMNHESFNSEEKFANDRFRMYHL